MLNRVKPLGIGNLSLGVGLWALDPWMAAVPAFAVPALRCGGAAIRQPLKKGFPSAIIFSRNQSALFHPISVPPPFHQAGFQLHHKSG